jgi:TolB protein
VDWSGDQHRLLLIGGGRALIIDTATGTSHRLVLPTSSDVSFAAPLGTTLLVDTGANSIERLALDGRILATYTVTGSQEPLIPISSPDGSSLIVTGRTTPLLIDAATGRVHRVLPAPPGRSFCRSTRRWTNDEVLLQCATSDGQDLWTESVDGSHLTRLTDRRLPHPAHDAGLGDLTAYRLDAGTFVLESGGCGEAFLSRLQADGSTRFLSLPISVVDPHNVRVVGTSPTALELLGRSGCARSTVLARYEPGTGLSFVQLGGHVAGGQVIAAAVPASYLR